MKTQQKPQIVSIIFNLILIFLPFLYPEKKDAFPAILC